MNVDSNTEKQLQFNYALQIFFEPVIYLKDSVFTYSDVTNAKPRSDTIRDTPSGKSFYSHK